MDELTEYLANTTKDGVLGSVQIEARAEADREPMFASLLFAGVGAQTVSPDGKTVDDFVIEENDCVVNLENAPCPAATASLNIGKLVVDPGAHASHDVPRTTISELLKKLTAKSFP